jgi:hypothetical protein
MRRAAAGLALLVVALAGCRKREDVAANGSTGKSVTIRTADGTVATSGKGSTLPADFPKDIPMYPRAEITAATSASGAAGEGRMIAFESADWPADIAKFYRSKLPGWKVAMDMSTEDGRVLILRSPDEKRSITLSAKREALNTVVTLTVSGK